MFDKLIEQYAEKVKPHVLNATNRADWYGTTVCKYLDRILDTLEDMKSETYVENHVRYPLTVESGSEVDLCQIPATEAWMLEVVTVLDACTITINESGAFRFARQFDKPDIMTPIGIPFYGGGSLTIAAETQSGNPVKVYVQLSKRIPKPSRPTIHTGMMNPRADGEEWANELDNLSRHATPLGNGRRVTGDR